MKRKAGEKEGNAVKRVKPDEEGKGSSSVPAFAIAHNFLTRSTVSDVLSAEPHRRFISLDHSTTVEEALHELASHHIMSAPVILAESLEDNDSGQFLGIFDVSSVVRQLISAVDEGKEFSLSAVGKQFCAQKLITVCGEDDVGMMFKAFSETTVHDLLSGAFLHAGSSGPVHRVCLFNAYGTPVKVVSQTDVVRFIHENSVELGSLGQRTVKELDIGTASVDCVEEHIPALEAFRLMNASHRSGLGVVNSGGKLVGNISASDVRGLTSRSFDQLSLSVHDFLKQRREYPDARYKPQLILLKETDTFEALLSSFIRHSVHRVYEIDSAGKPSRVITLTDVIKLVAAV